MKIRPLTDQERCDWVRLIRTDRIGPITFFKLVEQFGGAATALENLPAMARAARASQSLKPPGRDIVDREWTRAEKSGARCIAACEPDYPAALRAIADPPPVIYVRGRADLLSRDSAALIGARNASMAGRKMSRMLAEGLGREGFVVTSGLARGIDGAAHEAALSTGTVAVVAGGVDIVYPPEHRDLTERIARDGAIVSERPPGAEPTARDFPRRNRLISGLSLGVVVVEAAARSGTLITARFALEQGRDVLAVPGSPLDPRCEGANNLIRDGARLVQNASDVLDQLSQMRGRDLFSEGGVPTGVEERDREFFNPGDLAAQAAASAALRREVASLLSPTPAHRDDFMRETGAAPGLVLEALISLVLAGEAEEHPGGRFASAIKSDTGTSGDARNVTR